MWFLSYRTQEVGGPVASTPLLFGDADTLVGNSLRGIAEATAGVTFIIHGYNNSRTKGLQGERGFAVQLAQQFLALAGSQFVGVLWPGDARVGFISYPTEEADADRAAEAFARTLRETAFASPPNFIAHSLGCRVTLRTLSLLVASDPGRTWANQVVLLAGAVDNDVLAREARYLAGVRNAARIVNVASTEDAVLKWGYPVGDFFAGFFGGYTKTALGLYGPSSRPPLPWNVRTVQLREADGIGHLDYLGGQDPQKSQFIAQLAGNAILQVEPLV